jgi:hypothetical protein
MQIAANANHDREVAVEQRHQHEVEDDGKLKEASDAFTTNSFHGTLAHMGADGGLVTWNQPGDTSLHSDGKLISFELNADQTTLTAFTVAAAGEDRSATHQVVVFELKAHADGSYDFTQYHQLDAKANLNFGFTATDGDGDKVPGTLTIAAHSVPEHEGSREVSLVDDHDVIHWAHHEGNNQQSGSVDHVKNFDAKSHEVLDLRDLLSNEHSGSEGGLDKFLRFGTEDGKLALLVSRDGHLSNEGGVDQKIVLDGYASKDSLAHDLDGADHHGISDSELLKKLVDTGRLHTDS